LQHATDLVDACRRRCRRSIFTKLGNRLTLLGCAPFILDQTTSLVFPSAAAGAWGVSSNCLVAHHVGRSVAGTARTAKLEGRKLPRDLKLKGRFRVCSEQSSKAQLAEEHLLFQESEAYVVEM
jgi:hypothetical protein